MEFFFSFSVDDLIEEMWSHYFLFFCSFWATVRSSSVGLSVTRGVSWTLVHAAWFQPCDLSSSLLYCLLNIFMIIIIIIRLLCKKDSNQKQKKRIPASWTGKILNLFFNNYKFKFFKIIKYLYLILKFIKLIKIYINGSNTHILILIKKKSHKWQERYYHPLFIKKNDFFILFLFF